MGHLVSRFLPATETFVFSFVTRQERYRSVVVTEERENADLFPFAPVVVRSGWVRALDRAVQWATARPGLRRWPGPSSPFTRRALERVAPDVVHAHFGWAGCKAAPWRAAGGPPLVTSFYGLDASALARHPEWLRRFARLFATGDLFLAEGTALARKLEEIGCPRDKIRIQRIGIDADRFAFRTRGLAAGETPIVAMCASLREKKGHRYALAAFAALRHRGFGAKLRIIGGGPLAQELHELARDLRLTDVVEWLGMRPHDQCARLLAESHVFLHPSVVAENGDREGGAPTILLEAQATGMPVVATLHDDIPEVTVPGKSALLVPERDPIALSRALEEVLSAPARWQEMGRAGREHVLACHDVRRTCDRLADLYDEARGLGPRS